MAKKRGLGRSLDALLGASLSVAEATRPSAIEKEGHESIAQISVTAIQPGRYQPRRHLSEEGLEQLAQSIRSQGLIQPIVLRPLKNNRYEIIAGERRFRAAQRAGLQEVPAIIKQIPDESALVMALIENIQRENLNAIEEAVALQRLITEFDMTHQEIANVIGKSRATVSNLLRLLALPESIKSGLEQGQIEMGHARALLSLPETLQNKASEMIIAKKLSVREAEALVQRLSQPPAQTASSPEAVSPLTLDLQHLEEDFLRRLKLKVKIKHRTNGRGRLVIRYKNQAELERVLKHFETV